MMKLMKRAAARLTARLEKSRILQREEQVILLLTLVIGAVVGLVIVAFILLTENLGSRMYPAGSPAWRRVLVPVIGALATGFLLWRYFPDARGSGIPQTKAALFLRNGFISLRTVLGKFGLSSVSLASGIALGREGPSVQVGAGIASVLGRWLGLSQNSVRALLPVGASAALAAAFNTPIAAVLFSLEEVMGDMHAPVLGSIVLSSATSWIVLHLVLGDEPLFHVPAYQLVHPVELINYVVLGVAGGLVSVGFVKLLLWERTMFRRLPRRTEWLQPVAGGLLVGLLGWQIPEVLGVGYSHVSQALNGQMVVGTMALLVALKVLATATCYSSGNAGGIFGPSLFIGAMIGGTVGGIVHPLAPDYTGSIGAYALVGMGTAFAGIIRVPLTSVVMIFEITRDYSIIVPLMVSNLISYFISSKLQKTPIYEALQHQEGIHLPAGARERTSLVPVSRAVRRNPEVLRAEQSAAEALRAHGPEQKAWPVLDEAGLAGVITLIQLEQAVEAGHGGDTLSALARAGSAHDSGRRYLYPDEPLDTAMRRMSATGLPILPVVSRANRRELVGVVSLPAILQAYGLADGGAEETGAQHDSQAPKGRLTAIVTVLAGLLVVAASLSYVYREQRADRAERFFKAGNALMAQQRYGEAVEQFRNALSISHRSADRFALAEALLKAGRLNEADIYFRDLAKESPGSAPANLGLARIAARQGRTDDAVSHYRRAIVGSWPGKAETNRIETRLELAQVLIDAGQTKQARAELLSAAADLPNDPAIEKRAGSLMLALGLAKEASEVYAGIVERDKKDAEAYKGLGQAEFMRGDFRAAASAYGTAARLRPEDPLPARRAQVSEQIQALDPTVQGLRSAERYRRSQELLRAAAASLESCGPRDEAIGKALDAARAALNRRGRPRSYGDAADANISLAKEAWELRVKRCGAPQDQEAVAVLMTRLSR